MIWNKKLKKEIKELKEELEFRQMSIEYYEQKEAIEKIKQDGGKVWFDDVLVNEKTGKYIKTLRKTPLDKKELIHYVTGCVHQWDITSFNLPSEIVQESIMSYLYGITKYYFEQKEIKEK